MNSTTLSCVVLGLLALTVPTPGSAQTPATADTPPAAPRVSATPFVSMGSDFASRIGASIAFDVTPAAAIETEVGYRRHETSAWHASVNLLYELPAARRIRPYLAAGVGLEQFDVPLQVPVFGVIRQAKVGMSTSVGGGVKVSISDGWDYRTDARWLNPWGTSPEGWRIYQGVSIGLGSR